jgi:hypothetical protein
MVGRAPALSQLRSWTPPSIPSIPHSISAIPGIHSREEDKPEPVAPPSANGHSPQGLAADAAGAPGAEGAEDTATAGASAAGENRHANGGETARQSRSDAGGLRARSFADPLPVSRGSAGRGSGGR